MHGRIWLCGRTCSLHRICRGSSWGAAGVVQFSPLQAAAASTAAHNNRQHHHASPMFQPHHSYGLCPFAGPDAAIQEHCIYTIVCSNTYLYTSGKKEGAILPEAACQEWEDTESPTATLTFTGGGHNQLAPARSRISAIAPVTTRHAVQRRRSSSAASAAASGRAGNASRRAASAASVSVAGRAVHSAAQFAGGVPSSSIVVDLALRFSSPASS